jgi:hypothetical protein
MPRERSGREFHTRLGWWVMTHPRGGAAVIGWAALMLLAADIAYVAYQGHRMDTWFHRAFVVGAVGTWLVGLIADRLGVAETLGTDRAAARRRARNISKLHAPIPIAVLIAGFVFGSHVTVGVALGSFACVFGMFVVSAAQEIMHPHVVPSQAQALRATDPR